MNNNTDFKTTREWEMHYVRENSEREKDKHVKKIRLKLSPELSDGVHFSIIKNPKQIIEHITEFMQECKVGSIATIELVEMTDDEVDTLSDL